MCVRMFPLDVKNMFPFNNHVVTYQADLELQLQK